MAFKPIRLEDSTTAVSTSDPAIDHEHSDMEAYAEAMLSNPAAWREHIKAQDGETLTQFVIGVVPSEELTRIQDECKPFSDNGERKDAEIRWRCFLHGVRDIKGWAEDVPKKKVGKVEYVDPAWLRETFIKGMRYVALGIGFQIWMFNQFTEDEAKK